MYSISAMELLGMTVGLVYPGVLQARHTVVAGV